VVHRWPGGLPGSRPPEYHSAAAAAAAGKYLIKVTLGTGAAAVTNSNTVYTIAPVATVSNLAYGVLGDADPTSRIITLSFNGADLSMYNITLFGVPVTLNAQGAPNPVSVVLPDELAVAADADIISAIENTATGYLVVTAK
jgi:hypothetical protein